MAITFVQVKKTTNAISNQVSIQWTTSGNLLVAALNIDTPTATINTPATGSWLQAADRDNGGNTRTRLYYMPMAAARTNTFETWSFTGIGGAPVNVGASLVMAEYSGAQNDPLDEVDTEVTNATSIADTGTTATTSAEVGLCVTAIGAKAVNITFPSSANGFVRKAQTTHTTTTSSLGFYQKIIDPSAAGQYGHTANMGTGNMPATANLIVTFKALAYKRAPRKRRRKTQRRR